MRRAAPAEISRWDELVRANPDGGHMFQTAAWGELKRRGGWRPAPMVSDDPAAPVAALFLRRHVPALGWLWYSPKGPGVTSPDQLAPLLARRDPFAGAFCVQVEPELLDTPENRAALLAMGLRKGEDVQVPPATVIVDLDPSRDDPALLATFRRDARYNIGLAGRRGVTVEPVACDETNVRILDRLVGAAYDRHGTAPPRSLRYHSVCWRLFADSGRGQLFLARDSSEVVAGAFVAVLGEGGWYQDGGTSSRGRELRASHLLQWEVMRWLRGHGVRRYDLVTVPRPRDAIAANPLHGLWEFKTSFSTDVREFVGTWDLVLHESRYRIWKRAGEPVAKRLRWRLRHDLWY